MRPLRVLALDLGVANVGIAVTHDQVGQPRLSCRTVTPRRRDFRPNLMDHARVHETVTAVQAALRCRPDVVVIEKPIVASATGDMPIRLAEVHGAIKHFLWAKGFPYADVDPHHVKQYATGKGNADKPAVLAAVIATYGWLLAVHTYDEADAVAMMMAALDHYGSPVFDQASKSWVPVPEVPASHRVAVGKVTWPELAVSHG